MRINNHKGAALIMALMITALVAGIATLLFIRQQINIRITQLTSNYDRAYFYLQGTQFWAMDSLKQEDKKILPFMKMPVLKYKGTTITANLQDQTGLFNINRLASANNQQYFTRLLKKVIDPQITTNQANTIASSISNWLTRNDNADEIYIRKKPPYLAAKRIMASISELRLVDGIDARLFNKLQPFLTALPTTVNKININAASAAVLTTLAPNITLAEAQEIVAYRKEIKYFKTTDDFIVYVKRLGINIDSNLITATPSLYFLLHSYIKIDDQQLNLFTLLQRHPIPDKKSAQIDILRQSQG